MTTLSLIKVATVTVLTGALSACSFPYFKLPQAVSAETETAVVQPVPPVVQQQSAPLAAPAPAVVVTPVAETGPTEAEIAAQERRERRERREERRDRDSGSNNDDDDDDGRSGGWTAN